MMSAVSNTSAFFFILKLYAFKLYDSQTFFFLNEFDEFHQKAKKVIEHSFLMLNR